MRMEMREGGRLLEGVVLAEKLTRYSQRGKDYVRSIREIITVNRLEALDSVRLGDTLPSTTVITKPLI
jgi:Bax protein